MRPFDLEAAKAGKPVITREGNPVRLVCFDMQRDQPILGLIKNGTGKEEVNSWGSNGSYWHDNSGSGNDLLMAPEEITLWINLYKSGVSGTICAAVPFKSQEVAEANAKRPDGTFHSDYFGTFPLTITL